MAKYLARLMVASELSILTSYRNDWNKRPGRLLNFSNFYLGVYLRWALIYFLIKFGEDRKDNYKNILCYSCFLAFVSQ